MNEQKFIELFIDLFDDQPEVTINLSTVFKDLDDWDSLVSLSFMAMISEEYGVEITAEEVRTKNELGEIVELIANRL